MEIEIKRISMETIKPSSPTPKSLQKHYLSSIDQSYPQLFIPMVYFYKSNPKIPTSEKSEQFKKSLSDILSRFYPLAGRVVGNHYIDCNDGCAPFWEAEANCQLSQVLPNPDHNLMDKFLPRYEMEMEQHKDLCLAVQATYFLCGGVALGILVSHRAADAHSIYIFVKAWAAAARHGDMGSAPVPKFDAATYFPPLHDTSGIDATGTMTKEDVTTKIVTFPATKIAALREMYAASGGGLWPNRVEAVSAFLWSQFVYAMGAQSDPSKIYVVTNAVNIRSRVKPPLSDYHFGNIIGISISKLAAGDGGAKFVKKIRADVKRVDGGFVASQDMSELVSSEMTVWMDFSSHCRFPLYEADFGWGRPTWVGLGRVPFTNTVLLTDTESGGGIQALIHLSKQDMVKFESVFELQML